MKNDAKQTISLFAQLNKFISYPIKIYVAKDTHIGTLKKQIYPAKPILYGCGKKGATLT